MSFPDRTITGLMDKLPCTTFLMCVTSVSTPNMICPTLANTASLTSVQISIGAWFESLKFCFISLIWDLTSVSKTFVSIMRPMTLEKNALCSLWNLPYGRSTIPEEEMWKKSQHFVEPFPPCKVVILLSFTAISDYVLHQTTTHLTHFPSSQNHSLSSPTPLPHTTIWLLYSPRLFEPML